MRASTRRIMRPVLWTLGGLLTLATIATIAIHVAPVRAAFGWAPLGDTANGGGCPFGYSDADQTAAAPTFTPRAPRALGDTARAKARPALGFTLHATTIAEVRAWATTHGITCEAKRDGLTLECGRIAAALVPEAGALDVTSAWLSFASDGTLASVKTVRKSPQVELVVRAFRAAQATLTARAGEPSAAAGSAEPTTLTKNLLAQASVEYHFGDYRAVVRATHLSDGFALTESYAALD